METGIVNLKPLYDYVKDDCSHEGSKGIASGFCGKSPEGRKYGKILTEKVASIPNALSGIYSLGKFDNNRKWHDVSWHYSTVLRSGIREKLSDDRAFIYRSFLDEGLILDRVKICDYEKFLDNILGALKLKGTTYLLWAKLPGGLGHRELRQLKAQLISMEDGQNAYEEWRRDAEEITYSFARLIELERPNCFLLKTMGTSS